MRSVVVAARRRRSWALAWQASLVAATLLWPGSAAAQDPEQAPPPPPPPVEVAVPRVAQPRGEVRAPVSRAPEKRVREDGASENNGIPERAVERAPVRAAVSDDRPATGAVTAGASPGEQGRARRRGDVRRPPPSGADAGIERAIPRAEAPPPPDTRGRTTRGHYPSYPDYSVYYDPWGYGSFGLGYFYYSPWSWSPYGYPPAYGYPRYGGAFGFDVGQIKIKVKPRDAEVWVDGYYAGSVDDFDGMLQALKLDSGAYRIEIRKAGFETLTFDVRVQPERTITFRGEMKPVP